jgi:hypothetical protein
VLRETAEKEAIAQRAAGNGRPASLRPLDAVGETGP